ncbi:hypothetical protein TNCV_2566721 [Trichonephila clavipes]|uniref:Uncharacterized protein n=1 Tax=Trichonephila clavipes TaxID=2585209 RepID=A0A8X6WKQ0_TRICX|nr:hypothetical protein TNCV_2566721 [Trichonephila clavipes]
MNLVSVCGRMTAIEGDGGDPENAANEPLLPSVKLEPVNVSVEHGRFRLGGHDDAGQVVGDGVQLTNPGAGQDASVQDLSPGARQVVEGGDEQKDGHRIQRNQERKNQTCDSLRLCGAKAGRNREGELCSQRQERNAEAQTLAEIFNHEPQVFYLECTRRRDCFRESKVLCGLVQALDSEIHGMESWRVGGHSSDHIMSGKFTLDHSCAFLALQTDAESC